MQTTPVLPGDEECVSQSHTPGDAKRFINLTPGPGPNLFLAIEIGTEAVGGIGIHPLDDVRRRSAEIGYRLSESYWGRVS